MSVSNVILEIKDLQATVEGKAVLKGVNLTVNAGEVHAIMGPTARARARWRRCWRAIPPT